MYTTKNAIVVVVTSEDLLFVAKEKTFIKMDDLKPELRKEAEEADLVIFKDNDRITHTIMFNNSLAEEAISA